MRINCKQTIAKLFSSLNMLVVLLAGLIILFSSSTSFAPTKMSDADLADVEAQAIISIQQFTGSAAVTFGTASYWTGSQDVIRLSLGLDMAMNGHIRNFKAGWYGGGWDLDSTNWFFGTTDRATNLKWTGIYLDLGFDSYTSNASRVLNYVELGTMSASGSITESINTLNSLVRSGTGQNQGVLLRATASGRRIVTFNNEVMAFVFATKYRYTSPAGSTLGLSGIFIKIPNYDTGTINRP
jgi:hypothetical protein